MSDELEKKKEKKDVSLEPAPSLKAYRPKK